MRDPAMTCDGHSYEREAISKWLACSNLSPATGLVLRSNVLLPNHCLRSVIDCLDDDDEDDGGETSPSRSIGPNAGISFSSHGSMRRLLAPHSLLAAAAAAAAAGPCLALRSGGGAAAAALGLDAGMSVEEGSSIAPEPAPGAGLGRELVTAHAAAAALVVGVALCLGAVRTREERTALGLVATGVPLATLSFCWGLVCALSGDAGSALLLSRALLVAGTAFCTLGLALTRYAAPEVAADAAADADLQAARPIAARHGAAPDGDGPTATRGATQPIEATARSPTTAGRTRTRRRGA
jgi:hypothetical protein